MIVRALFVEDKPLLAKQLADNIAIAVLDHCGIQLEFKVVETAEDAKRCLPRGQDEYRLVVTDMLFPSVEGTDGGLLNRGIEIIHQAKKTENVVVVAISIGDTTHYPTLHEDARALGAIFRYKQEMQGPLQGGSRVSRWDELAREICAELKGENRVRREVTPNAARVFVVSGKNDPLNKSIFAFLRSVGLQPVEWEELVTLAQERSGGHGNPSIIDIIRVGFENTYGAVVLLSPDDEARLRAKFASPDGESWEHELIGQPRQNVLLEAGYALGYCFERTLIVSVGKIRPVSDLSGMEILRLDDTREKRKAFAQRLGGMGFDINMSGEDWMSTGTFME